MLDNAIVYVFGTDHDLQCGDVRRQRISSIHIQQYQDAIQSVIESKKIRVIFEEWHPTVREHTSYNNTLLQIWYSNTELAPHHIDLGCEDRTRIGCPRECINIRMHLKAFFDNHEQSESVCPKDPRTTTTDCDCELLVDEIRERVWVYRIRKKNIWPALLVCGSNHTVKVHDLFGRFGVKSNILYRDFGKIP